MGCLLYPCLIRRGWSRVLHPQQVKYLSCHVMKKSQETLVIISIHYNCYESIMTSWLIDKKGDHICSSTSWNDVVLTDHKLTMLISSHILPCMLAQSHRWTCIFIADKFCCCNHPRQQPPRRTRPHAVHQICPTAWNWLKAMLKLSDWNVEIIWFTVVQNVLLCLRGMALFRAAITSICITLVSVVS